MHLDSDDVLEGCDALADTLAAARTSLEALAARSLSFAAQVRVQRESTRAARAWVRAHVDLSTVSAPPPPLPAPPTTVPASPTTVSASPPASPSAASEPASESLPDAPALHDDLDPLDPLAGLDLQAGGELDDFDALGSVSGLDPVPSTDVFDADDALAPAPTGSDEPLITFDDPEPFPEEDEDDGDELSHVDPGDGAGRSSVDDHGDPYSPLESSGPLDTSSLLVQFEDDADPSSEEQLVQGAGSSDRSFADLISFDEADDDPSSEAASDREPDSADESGDKTLVTDLESLVQLRDLLAEDEGTGLADTPEREPSPVSHERAMTQRSGTTLTAEDLGRLGFASGDALLSPEGADADPASDTGSTPAPRVTSDDPPRPRTHAAGAAAVRVGVPTIRDSAAQARPDRASVAAIQINPTGGGSVINEPITLELGEAEGDWDEPSETGLALQVEEYEADLEPLDELEPESEPQPEPEPAAVRVSAPTLSGSQLTGLLKRAAEAVEQGDLRTAIELFSDALDFDPDNVKAAVGRGLAWLDLADYARAMSDFKIAEEIAPNNAEVIAAIGKLYYDRKDYGRAVDYLDRAVQLDPKHAMAWCRRGISHYYRKDYAKAYNNLIEAEKLDPNIPNIRTYIGMVRKRMK